MNFPGWFFRPNNKKRCEHYLRVIKCGLNSAEGVGSDPDIEILLKKIFIYNNIRYKKLNYSFWSKFFDLISCSSDKQVDFSGELSLDIVEFDCMLMNTDEWLELYFVSLALGLFQIAYSFRSKASERSTILNSLSIVSKKKIRRYLSVSLEKNVYDIPDNLSRLLKHLGKFRELYLFNRWQASLLKDNISRSRNSILSGSSLFNNDFYEFVCDKSVAIVGPLLANAENADSIDKHDIVARFNYLRSAKGCDPIYCGVRCDISAFNGSHSNYFLENFDKTLPRDLKWALFKSADHANILGRHNSNIKIDSLTDYSSFFFNGSLNMLPVMVINLLIHGVRKIKIFNSDLLLSEKRYAGYSFRFNDNDRLVNFCIKRLVHDPVTQYIFLKNLYDVKIIEGDKRFEEVMSLGVRKYMVGLEDVYGKYANQ